MANIKPISIPTKTLSQSITSAATSFILSDIKGWNGSDLTASDFGTKAYGILRNSAGTLMEIFEFDPSTIADGSIDFVARGLKFDGTLDTEVAANKLSWVKGDTFVDIGTDVPQLLGHMVMIIGSAAIIEQLQYSTELTPTDRKDLVSKGYVDDLVNGGTVSINRVVVAGNAGETVASGDLVYFDDTDNEWKLCDANDSTTLNEVLLGIAQGAGTDGGAISNGILIRGLDETQTGMTVGVKLYASDTAGVIAESAGTVERIIGFSKSATQLYFDPYFGAFVTADEKDAMAGTQGVPNSSNTFATKDNIYEGATDQSQTTQDATVEFGEADATTKKQLIAQSFIATKTKIDGVKLWKEADTGTFTGTVTVSIQADDGSGDPAGSDLATVTLTNVQWLALADSAEFEAIFSSEYSLTVGSTYWILATSSTNDSSNHPNLGTNSAGGYANGSVKYKNTSDGWIAISTIDLYFKTLHGTNSQIVKTDSSGHIPSVLFSPSKMPIPAFQQIIPIDPTATDAQKASGSSQDGSVLYLYQPSTNELWRLERDSVTGMYFRTHDVSTTASITANDYGSIVELGDYIYLFANDNTNIEVTRFDKADLTNETSMTVPTVSATSNVLAWTDGVNIHVVSANASTTSHEWSISGTTMSAVDTATIPAGTFNQNHSAMMFDGTDAYLVDRSSPPTTDVSKLSALDGSSVGTADSYSIQQYTDDSNGVMLINIDDTRAYIGTLEVIYDETGNVANHIVLHPIVKPS